MRPAPAMVVAVIAVLGSIVSATALSSVVPAAAAAAPATIAAPQPVAAPSTAPGGIVSPAVACGNPAVKPHVMWTLNDVATGAQPTYSWVGGTAGARFPRVEAGTYVSTTSVTCRRQQTVQTVTVVVPRKTRATTMSRHEFRRISHGMRRSTVDRIVGYPGRLAGLAGHRRTVVYDRDELFAAASVRFRHGRVVGKHWTVG